MEQRHGNAPLAAGGTIGAAPGLGEDHAPQAVGAVVAAGPAAGASARRSARGRKQDHVYKLSYTGKRVTPPIPYSGWKNRLLAPKLLPNT